jgi:hypothetical protein
MKLIASLVFSMSLAPATSVYGQEWQEIKPIESTRKDVVRVFGERGLDRGGRCGAVDECSYDLPRGGTIHFSFSVFTCQSALAGMPWNIPPGTVTMVWVIPGPAYNLSISDLNMDESKSPGEMATTDL